MVSFTWRISKINWVYIFALGLKCSYEWEVIIGGIVLAVYVDNLLIAGKDEADILHIKELLKARFEVKDLDEIRMVLGIRMRQYG